jgi:hypothetical protein
LLYQYDAPLSWKQIALVRQFDRSDVPSVREMVFNAIKEGKYPEHTDFVC